MIWLRLPLSVKVWLAAWFLLVFGMATVVMDLHDHTSGYYKEYEEEDRMLFEVGDGTYVAVNPRAYTGGQK